mmetsp:Transcript_16015/g.24132  ORF Transcript_16015/g.24132 Transcript_16015/m.24132 type:complete len:242 (-) Transcript_16015:1765-2490(-)
MSPHDFPIFTAVFCLSPVNTHILIPAFLRSLSVCGTPSCNLSSIAVTPRTCKFPSIFSATFSIFCLRFPFSSANDFDAASYSAFHDLYSDSVSFRCPTSITRSPSRENWKRWASVCSQSFFEFTLLSFEEIALILLSAPLVRTLMVPSGNCTMTLIRFLSDVKARICKILKTTRLPDILRVPPRLCSDSFLSISITFISLDSDGLVSHGITRVTSFLFFFTNRTPCILAAVTRATSSVDSP